MSGPWEKYKANAVESGPWDKYRAKANEEPAAKAPETSALAAFGEGAGQGLTAGYLPQLQAMAEPAINRALYGAWKAGLVPGLDPSLAPETYDEFDEGKSYVELRDENIKRLRKQAEEHPVAAGAGMLTGGVVGGIATAGLLPEAAAVGAAGKLAQAAKAGAAYGAIANPGDKEGEISPFQVDERVKNAALGAVTGAATAGAIDLAGRGLKRTGDYWKKLANEKAFKSTGANKKEFVKNFNTPGQTAENKVQEIGREMLDNKVVRPLSTPKKIAERLSAKISEKEAQLGKQIQDVENLLASGNLTDEQTLLLNSAKFDPKSVLSNLKEEIRSMYPGVPDEKLAPAFNEIEAWLGSKTSPMGIADVQRMKVSMNSFLKDADFYREPGIAKAGTLAVRRALKEGVEDQADTAARALGGRSGGIAETNRSLGNLYAPLQAAEDKIARDAANRAFGLTDTISGGAGASIGSSIGGSIGGPTGAAVGGAVGGGVGAAVNKLGRTFGNSTMATGFDRAANISNLLGRYSSAMGRDPRAASLVANAATNRPTFKEADPRPEDNSDLLRMLTERPELIDKFKDADLRERLRRKLGRQPSQQKAVSEQEAQKQFIDGN